MTQTGIPKKAKIIMAVLALFMPVFLILPFFFWGGSPNDIYPDQKKIQALRLAPIGKLNVGEVVAAAETETPKAAFEPQAVYDKVCAACHANGTLNAPVFGNKEAWQKRLTGHGDSLDALVESGIKGLNSMPPKGGAAISDAQFRDMVIFMLDKAGVKY